MTIHNTLLDGISLDSGDFRRMMHAILGGTPGAFAGGVGATDGLAHGVCGTTHLKVSQNLTPNMGVKVTAGLASIRANSSATLGPFPFYSDADESLVVPAAHASLTRRDLVIAIFYTNGNPPALLVVPGTPGSGADPSLVGFPNCQVLARITLPGAASSVTDAMIADLRTFAGIYGAARFYAPKRFGIAGSAVAGITGIATVCSLSIPAQPSPGELFIVGKVRGTKSVAADGVMARLWIGGSNIDEDWHTYSTPEAYAKLSAGVALAVSTAATLTMSWERTSGTTTIATTGAYTQNHLEALWVPTF